MDDAARLADALKRAAHAEAQLAEAERLIAAGLNADHIFLVHSRDEAIAKDELRYWSAEPCPMGHVGARWTEDDQCTRCHGLAVAREVVESAMHRVFGSPVEWD